MQIYSVKSSNNKFEPKRNNIKFCGIYIPRDICEPMGLKSKWVTSLDIFTHKNSDKDSKGLAKALANIFVDLGKRVRIINDAKFPEYLSDRKNNFIEFINPSAAKNLTPNDLAFVVDFSVESRLPEDSLKLLNKYHRLDRIGIDHHKICKNDIPIIGSPIYIDPTAKSASEIGYQFITRELTPNPDQNTLFSLYCGILDDLLKSDYLEMQHSGSKIHLIEKNPIPSETKKVLNEIQAKLPAHSLEKAKECVDILSNLSPAEKKFQAGLINRMEITPDNKFAYVVIDPNDNEWKKIEHNNEAVRSILHDFRKRIIENNNNDLLIPSKIKSRLNNIQAIAMFYKGTKQSDEAQECYRMSIQSKNNYGKLLSEYLQEYGLKNNLKFNAGGPPNRSGGNAPLKDWQTFVDAAIEFMKSEPMKTAS